MINIKCAQIADENRIRWDFGRKDFLEFPEGCPCACQHRQPVEWEKMFKCKPPWEAKIDVKEIL